VSATPCCSACFVLFNVFVFLRVILSGCPKLDLSTILQHFFFKHLFNLDYLYNHKIFYHNFLLQHAMMGPSIATVVRHVGNVVTMKSAIKLLGNVQMAVNVVLMDSLAIRVIINLSIKVMFKSRLSSVCPFSSNDHCLKLTTGKIWWNS